MVLLSSAWVMVLVTVSAPVQCRCWWLASVGIRLVVGFGIRDGFGLGVNDGVGDGDRGRGLGSGLTTVLATASESGSGLELEMQSGSVQSLFYWLTVLTMG